MLVKDVMTKDVMTVGLKTTIHELAELFVEKVISGAPVIGFEGEYLGIVQEEGVMFQDKKVHLPTFIHILGGFLTLGIKKYEEEMKKIAATTVSDILENDAKTVSPDMTIEALATMMLEENVHYCPVVEDTKLVGVVTKKDIIKSIAKS